jgi:hypothetical protein
LVVRELAGVLEMALALPRAVLDGGPVTLDVLCQAVEGVSHFLYLAERARRELPATQLELEIQAEIDKYLLLAIVPHAEREDPAIFEPRRAAAMREHLFDRVVFVHEAGSEHGDRYRLANRLAARFARRLETTLALRGRFLDLQAILRRFYAVGQTEKIELALAA